MNRKNILITGTSSGFGRLATETLARQGHTVFATMRGTEGKNAEKAHELRQLAKEEDLEITVIELDVTDAESIQRAAEEVKIRSGRLDVLINNAGITGAGMTESFTTAQARLVFETNYFGVIGLTRALLPMMKQQGEGLIINVSSILGRVVLPASAHYSASKFALEAFSETLRYELSGLGIDVTIVEPGAYPTEILGKFLMGNDTSRLESYGEISKFPERVGEIIEKMISAPDANDPQEIADGFASLINMEHGKRPLRVIVGKEAKSVVNSLNKHTAERQREILEMFGFDEIASLST